MTATVFPDEWWSTTWRVAAIFVVLLLVRASVFRHREHDADVRASTLSAPGDARFLSTAFPDPPDAGTATRGAVTVRRARQAVRRLRYRALRAHPSTGSRAAVVDDPTRLLDARFAEGLGAGVATAITFCYVHALAIGLGQGDPRDASLIAGLLVGLLTATVSGFAIWRSALAAVVQGRPVPRGARAGAGLATGLLLGELVAPAGTTAWPWLLRVAPLSAVVAGVLLVVGCLVFTRWSAATATAWLAASRARRLRSMTLWSLPFGALAFGSMYGLWFNAVAVAVRVPTLGVLVSNALPSDGFVLIPLALAIAFPLAVAARPGGSYSPARSLLLDAADPVRLCRTRTRVALVLAPPLVLGVVCVLADTVRGRSLLLDITGTGTDPGGVGTEALLLLGGVLVGPQVLVTVVVAVLCRRGRVRATFAHPLIAGLLTGCVPLATMMVYPAATTCGSDCFTVQLPRLLGFVLTAMILLAFAVAPVIWGLVTVVSLVRHRRREASPPPERARGPRRARVLLATMIAVALLVLTPVMVSTLAGTHLLPGRMEVSTQLRQVPPAQAASSPLEACTRYINAYYAWLEPTNSAGKLSAARSAQRSGAPGLTAVGRTLDDAIMTGDPDGLALADSALYPICSRWVYGRALS